jgi:hypothetical protein
LFPEVSYHNDGSSTADHSSFSIQDNHGCVVQVSIDSPTEESVQRKSHGMSQELILVGCGLMISSTVLIWTSQSFLEKFSYPNVLSFFQYFAFGISTLLVLLVYGRPLKSVPQRYFSSIVFISLVHAATNLAINYTLNQGQHTFIFFVFDVSDY